MLNLEFSTFPILKTQRLALRQLLPTDAAHIHQLRADPEINRYIDRPNSTGIDEAEAFIHKIDSVIAAHEGMYWVITLTGDDTLIGTICFWNFDRQNDTIEIGYELMRHQQGKGNMAEAISKVIAYGFKQMQAKAITAFLSADNAASVALLKKLNFTTDNDLQTSVNKSEGNMLAYSLNPTS